MPKASNDRGWFPAYRSEDALELIAAYPLAYVLAAVIALRARWRSGFNRHGLNVGEAFLGDFRACGMSEQEYRTAKAKLQQWGFATFRPTNRGTVGKLLDSRLFSESASASHGQHNAQVTARATPKSRPGNEPATSNKKGKNVKRGQSHPPAVQFEPVKRGLYPREYEAMLAQVEAEIKTLVTDRQNYEMRLAAESAHLIETLKAEGKEARAKEVEDRSDSWVKGAMKPEPRARLDAWKGRRSEIKAAMAGIVAAN